MTKVAVLLTAVLVCGCGRVDNTAALLGECFVEAAYRCRQAEKGVVVDEPCCGNCGKKGLPRGKVLSGDGLAVVPCPCPDTCECKR